MGNQKKMNFKKLEVLAQNQKCVFCHTSEINEIKLGPVYMYQNIITHYYCLVSSNPGSEYMYFNIITHYKYA